ncbi:MAG: ActS/PrrB/RegB family redox-sensitive histidine kinase [Pelagibacterales bacterium]|nr:ActS/PrrB/RegB family redox-sensitive histidine kinase [Pelagibacterales bacterium]
MKQGTLNIQDNISLKLRTLIFFNWIAIIGQSLAVFVSFLIIEVDFNLFATISLIVLLLLLNIFLTLKFPITKALNFNEITIYLLFDLLQLISLLYLTGGLTNPFCILILVPIVISSTYLDLKRTILICAASIISLSTLLFFYVPISSNLINFNSDSFSKEEILSIWGALIITLIFMSAYCYRTASESRKAGEALRETQMALSNEEKVSALMSLTAAAVHELGTPLSTISVVSKELVGNIKKNDVNYDDLQLIQTQVKRCADILKRLRTTKFVRDSDEFLNEFTFTSLINEILEDYSNEKIEVSINADEIFSEKNITFSRVPEVIQSLSNIIDNAFKYAKNKIIINLKYAEKYIIVEIIDDGNGFSPEIYALLGEPYVRRSIDKEDKGLGLGLFISKNLLNRSYGDIEFLNYKPNGACVRIFLNKKELNIK